MEFNTARRTCFFEEDDGLASLADMEAGFSGKSQNVNVNSNNKNPSPHIARPVCSTIGGFRSAVAICVPCSPRSGRFYDARFEDFQHPHFLEACYRCRKPLGNNKDIFMYRGDTAFCSEECREEQIEMDEAKEKNWNLSSSMKALRKKDQRKAATSPSKAQDYPYRNNAVAAA